MDPEASPIFLKWAGGKRRLLESLQPYFPVKIERYFEPFLGGGSMFFYIKEKYSPKYICISDVNEDLVNTYRSVRDNLDELLIGLEFFKERDSIDFYYRVRSDFNSRKIRGVKRSAAFIYMNKTCYSGIYRVNSKNEFNVPYGKYKKPQIFNTEVLTKASRLLQGVQIECQDYRKVLRKVRKDDFIYLDPCYDPIKRTSFVQYTPERFSDADRVNLADFVLKATARGGKILLSNNDVKEVRELYPGFNQHKILAPRSLGFRSGAPSQIMELAISNY